MNELKIKLKIFYWKLFRPYQYGVYLHYKSMKKVVEERVKKHLPVKDLRKEFNKSAIRLDYWLQNWK